MAVRVLAVLVVLLVFGGISGRAEQAFEVSSWRFMEHLMSMNGCCRFAGLVNATANATEIFHQIFVHGGLVLFCPDDEAVAAFEPSFNDLCADDQLAVLLYHGVTPASLKDRRPTKALTVSTLATNLANGGYSITICHCGDAMELSSSSGGVARVTGTGKDKEEPLVVYPIDAVLLPMEHIECDNDEGPLWREAVTGFFHDFLILIAVVMAFVSSWPSYSSVELSTTFCVPKYEVFRNVGST